MLQIKVFNSELRSGLNDEEEALIGNKASNEAVTTQSVSKGEKLNIIIIIFKRCIICSPLERCTCLFICVQYSACVEQEVLLVIIRFAGPCREGCKHPSLTLVQCQICHLGHDHLCDGETDSRTVCGKCSSTNAATIPQAPALAQRKDTGYYLFTQFSNVF